VAVDGAMEPAAPTCRVRAERHPTGADGGGALVLGNDGSERDCVHRIALLRGDLPSDRRAAMTGSVS
jgi:hypothetical protein